MRAFHDSRDNEHRIPYGTVEPGEAVALSLDVWDAPGARVQLRTWIDGVGEALYEMASTPAGDGATRYTATLVPDAAGIVWYQFIIEAPGAAGRRRASGSPSQTKACASA